jgi:monovalent cation:proton antiporter-2 (CPA2) family protein
MQRVLSWKNRKGRSLLAAAAFAMSVLFISHQQLGQYSPVTQSSPAEINKLQQRKIDATSNVVARGGETATVAVKLPRFARNEKSMVEEVVVTAAESTSRTLKDALVELHRYMQGPKSDTMLLLLATALITPICQRIGISPILGFLASGMLLGPNGWGLITGIHTTETLAELGIVFFLFEMGIELSVDRLLSMKRDVFGLGLSQFLCTALAIAGIGGMVGLPANALVVLGGGLALSSSAFVLQLLKDKNQLATRFGKASFGILLFQDLAVVPLLVVTPILAGGGGGLAQALGSAVLKAGLALGSITLAGRYLLNPLFKVVASAQSQEAFLGVILLTVLGMSFMTEGLGLSNTLGAFLAGVLLSETKYRYQVEADIAPFRGVLLGLFFVTVGFEIDVSLILSNLPQVLSIVFGILGIKALTTTALSMAFGLSLSVSQQTGLLLSQGGEFAFVTFGLARSLGILDQATTKLLLTSVALTMALTPAMSAIGQQTTKKLEEKSDFTHYLGQDQDANEIKESDDFAVVIGYGAVGKVVCDLLDRKLSKYVAIDIDPNKAITARNAGLPVFYGDIGRQEVAEAFNVGKAKAVIVCISDQAQCTRAVIALRRFFPNLKIFARATDKDHAFRLQSTLDVAAMVPILPEDNVLLTLPFGGAVLKSLGGQPEEVNAILETKRKEVMSGKSLEFTEEDMALVQLGIEPNKKSDDSSEPEEPYDEDLVHAATKTAAVERLEKTKDKSPFVAEVISQAANKKEEAEVEEDTSIVTLTSEAAPALEVVEVKENEGLEVVEVEETEGETIVNEETENAEPIK